MKRAIIRNNNNNNKNSSHKKKNNILSKKENTSNWNGKLTEPKEFHFRTKDRSIQRNYQKNAISELNIKVSPKKKSKRGFSFTHLTEPQSPFFHTKQRAQLKKQQNRSISIVSDNVDSEFSTFDRECNNEDKFNHKKRSSFRNSLTEPKPFYFKTEDRANIRSLSRNSIDTTTLIKEDNNDNNQKSWKGTLTEPKPFEFATEIRSKQRRVSTITPIDNTTTVDMIISEPTSTSSKFDIFSNSSNNRKLKRRSSSSLSCSDKNNQQSLRKLTEPKPFHFQTEQRSLQKIEQNRLHLKITSKNDKTNPMKRTTTISSGKQHHTKHIKRKAKIERNLKKPSTTIFHNNRAL